MSSRTVFRSLQAWILLFGVKRFRHDVLVTFLKSLTVNSAAHIFAQSFDRGFSVGPHLLDRFDMSPDIAPHRIGMFLDESARRGNTGMLKNQTHLRDISNDAKPRFSAIKLEGGLMTAAVTRPVRTALRRSGPLPT